MTRPAASNLYMQRLLACPASFSYFQVWPEVFWTYVAVDCMTYRVKLQRCQNSNGVHHLSTPTSRLHQHRQAQDRFLLRIPKSNLKGRSATQSEQPQARQFISGTTHEVFLTSRILKPTGVPTTSFIGKNRTNLANGFIWTGANADLCSLPCKCHTPRAYAVSAGGRTP